MGGDAVSTELTVAAKRLRNDLDRVREHFSSVPITVEQAHKMAVVLTGLAQELEELQGAKVRRRTFASYVLGER